MIEMSPHLATIVTIGRFNPSILTEMFLKEKCGYVFSGKAVPRQDMVSSEVKDNRFIFNVEMSRLQFAVEDWNDESVLELLDITATYLEVLAYTPITAMGLNFHYLCSGHDSEDVNAKIYERVKNLGLRHGTSIEIGVSSRITDSNVQRLRGIELKIFGSKLGITSRITLSNIEENLRLSLNFEVSDLEKYNEKKVHLRDSFPEIVKMRDAFLQELFPEK